MRGLSSVLLVLFTLLTSGVSLAITSSCPGAQGKNKSLGPAVAALGSTTYLCSNAAYTDTPPTLGDLSPQGAALNAQLCDSHCSYHPLFPDDPNSPLLPSACGGQQISRPYAINGNAISQAKNQGAGAPYMGTGGNCLPLMVPQAPINLEDQKPPTAKVVKPAKASPSPSPSPAPHS